MTKVIVAELEACDLEVVTRRIAWGKDATNAPAIRCSCGKWMLLNLEQVEHAVNGDGVIHLAHFLVMTGGDVTGLGCGEDAYVVLRHFWRYIKP